MKYQIVLRNNLDCIIGLSDFYDENEKPGISAVAFHWMRDEHITLAIGDTLSIEEVEQ